ncbi:MAG: zf-HC2 domain-containing protein [Actinobacteria bacterium]|nr:zf-HC2 domain-containing protein [Actinomycetota bacterium]
MSPLQLSSCRHVVDLVTEYLEGGLPPDERLAFERHVAICPPCRGYLSQMRRVQQVAGSLSDDDVPERLRASLLEAFHDWKTTQR